MLYLYGITDAREPLQTPPRGLENRAAGMVPFDGMAAVTGELLHGRPEANERHLRGHFRVVEAFMACHTVLPVRFGTVFAGLEGLQAHLAHAHDVYSSDLKRLRGQIELSVRAIGRAAPAVQYDDAAAFALAGAGPGTRYLAAKHIVAAHNLAQRRRAEDMAALFMERLAPLATQVEWRALETPPGAAGVSMAFLVQKARLDAFRETAAALRSSEAGLDILLTGPWPPYSFVSAPPAADALSGTC